MTVNLSAPAFRDLSAPVALWEEHRRTCCLITTAGTTSHWWRGGLSMIQAPLKAQSGPQVGPDPAPLHLLQEIIQVFQTVTPAGPGMGPQEPLSLLS